MKQGKDAPCAFAICISVTQELGCSSGRPRSCQQRVAHPSNVHVQGAAIARREAALGHILQHRLGFAHVLHEK